MGGAHAEAPHRLEVEARLPGVLITDVTVVLVARSATERQRSRLANGSSVRSGNQGVNVAFLDVERARVRVGVAGEQEGATGGQSVRRDILTLIPVLGAEGHRDRARPR